MRFETLALPANDRIRLCENEGIPPAAPSSCQKTPENTISRLSCGGSIQPDVDTQREGDNARYTRQEKEFMSDPLHTQKVKEKRCYQEC